MKNRCKTFQTSVPANSEVALLLHCIDSCETLGSVFLSTETFTSIEQRAKESGLTLDALLKSIVGALADGSAQMGHKKSFFQVNLSDAEQKQMRKDCRELGVELRTVIRNAVIGAKCDLARRMEFKRITGMSLSDQWSFFGKATKHN